MWHGAICKVPLLILERWTKEGVIALIDVLARYRVIFLIRFGTQGDKDVSLTAEWVKVCAKFSPMATPPPLRIAWRFLGR